MLSTQPPAGDYRAGVYSAAAAFAGVLLGSLGAIAGQADRLQPFFAGWSPGHGRFGVEPCGVLQEPRSVAYLGCCPAVLRRGEQAVEEAHVRRALHRRRHPDPGVGLAGELAPRTAPTITMVGVSRREAQQRYASVHHRFRCAVVQEKLLEPRQLTSSRAAHGRTATVKVSTRRCGTSF
jgi:hypothetical protein